MPFLIWKLDVQASTVLGSQQCRNTRCAWCTEAILSFAKDDTKNESKVAWMRVKRMPSDQTRNHPWRIAHQIVLHAQPTDRCKCGKRMTVDHVYFESRFVKALWQVFAQSIGLNMKALTPQTQQPFMAATLFHLRFRQKKDVWCDMAHSVVSHQAWV